MFSAVAKRAVIGKLAVFLFLNAWMNYLDFSVYYVFVLSHTVSLRLFFFLNLPVVLNVNFFIYTFRMFSV